MNLDRQARKYWSERKAAPDTRLVPWAKSFSDELRYQAREPGVARFLPRGLSKEAFVEKLLALADADDLSNTPLSGSGLTLTLRS